MIAYEHIQKKILQLLFNKAKNVYLALNAILNIMEQHQNKMLLNKSIYLSKAGLNICGY